MRVSVIIVTWNSEKFIQQCLDSVFTQDIQVHEVFVVDNGSIDRTLEIVKQFGPKVILIENKQNKGFCFANNQAINKAKGGHILTLNSDIVLEPDYLYHLLDCFKHNPQVGMAQGKFLRMDKLTIDSLGLRLGLCFRLFNIAEGKQDSTKFNKSFEIFGPCAAAALYRKTLLKDISWKQEVFDPNFFFLVEDFDLAWRAKNRGWKGMYVAAAVCYHYRESSEHSSLFKQYLSFRNRYFLLIKNGTGAYFFRFILGFFIYELPRFIYLLLVNLFTLKAIFEIIHYLPGLIKRRSKNAKKNTDKS